MHWICRSAVGGGAGRGATTPAEFRKSIEKDRSLERRLRSCEGSESESDAVKIMYGIKDRYEKFHAVSYTDDAIEAAVFTSSRYIPAHLTRPSIWWTKPVLV